MTCEGAFVYPAFPFLSHRRQKIVIVLSVRETEELVMKRKLAYEEAQLMVAVQGMLKHLEEVVAAYCAREVHLFPKCWQQYRLWAESP